MWSTGCEPCPDIRPVTSNRRLWSSLTSLDGVGDAAERSRAGQCRATLGYDPGRTPASHSPRKGWHTMKAAYIEQFGGPEVLKYGDLADPSPGPGQIVVDIVAASVNGADWKV